jgi:hypothetical protein
MFARNSLYTEWAEGKCGTKVHTDPCSCTFSDQTQCANGRITYIDMSNQGLPGSSGIPLALLDLTGLSSLGLGGNALQLSVPAAIGQLQQLIALDLDSNAFTGTLPQSLTTLKHLLAIALESNLFTGTLPAFNFSQLTVCCSMSGSNFICPLPAGANTCDHSGQGSVPPPTCK